MKRSIKQLMAIIIAILMLAAMLPTMVLATDSITSYELSVRLFNRLLDDEDVINSFYLDINHAYPEYGRPGELGKVADFGRTLTEGMTDNYQKAKVIFEWFEKNFKYNDKFLDEKNALHDKYLSEGYSDIEAWRKTNDLLEYGPTGRSEDRFYSSFEKRTGVCLDYAFLFRIMAVGAGVPTDQVILDGHRGNIFWYDKESRWVLVDATWHIFDMPVEEFSELESHWAVNPGLSSPPEFYNMSAYWNDSTALYKGERLADRCRVSIDDGILVRYLGEESTVVVPPDVVSIGARAFEGRQITCIIIPPSVTAIGEDALSTTGSGLTVYGEAGSCAEAYAKANGIPFSTGYPEAPSIDAAAAWAREGINSAVAKGIVPEDLQSDYTNVITRQEFCRMAVNFVEYCTGQSIDQVLAENGVSRRQDAFVDTNDPDILAAYALGITSGTGANTFSPDGQFSREQAAAMIMNACKAAWMDTEGVQDAGFADMGGVSPWAVDGVNFCAEYGIMNGVGNNQFHPKGTYTRQESMVAFDRISWQESDS